MAHARTLFGSHKNETGGHGDKPWVYFMIDSFFLVTQFFILTFHLNQDLVLPNKLSGIETFGGSSSKIVVGISVNRQELSSTPEYKINGGEPMEQASLTAKLSKLTGGRIGDSVDVRVSYLGHANFGDVLPVIGVCKQFNFKCGIQPSRLK